MSAKGRRSLAWDDRVFPAWAWPFKALLRAFSSITLAVILLTAVAVYCALASVPIGMLALAPTYLIYALTLVVAIAIVAGPPCWLLGRALRRMDRGLRFAAIFLSGLALGAGAVVAWTALIWPLVRWNPSTGEGLRLFAGFVAAYESTTVRRLPALEMTEGQFYAWWPLRIILLLFVVNMIVATVRRIEFNLPHLGVLTVHTGIVVLALGSMHYQALKQEGDVLLVAGPDGEPGPATSTFHDRTTPALWLNVSQRGWRQAALDDLPRYNDYGIGDAARPLDLAIAGADGLPPIDGDIALRITGFGSYVELEEQWVRREAPSSGRPSAPLLIADLTSRLPLDDAIDEDAATSQGEARTVGTFRLPVASPAQRVVNMGDAIAVEHVPASDGRRWTALASPWPGEGAHALRIRVEGADEAVLRTVSRGDRIEAGEYAVVVEELAPAPPFPIITPGYEGAISSVAIVRVEPPDDAPYRRYVYHRFPELNQDIHGFLPDGRPDRRDADPSIRIEYLDASMVQVYLRSDGAALIRLPGGERRLLDPVHPGDAIQIAPMVELVIRERWPHAVQVERPALVPEAQRDRQFVGTHDKAALRVEVSLPGGWSRNVWLPFAKYMGAGLRTERRVDLPDGRVVELAFGRLLRPLPGIALQLADFEMIPYAHSDVPRDYVSEILLRDLRSGAVETHITRLNRPLIHRAPFTWSDERPWLANALGRVMSVAAPNQFKFSQAGWDAQGWRETQQRVEAGELERPRAAFTILGVGNNPGIYIIALGSVMVCLGIPWAFYVKPWLVRRRKQRVQAAAASNAPAKRPRVVAPTTSPQPVEAAS